MATTSTLIGALLWLSLLTVFCPDCGAQSQTTSTENEVWPEADVYIPFPSNLRLLAFTGLEQAIDYPFQQWYAGAGVGVQVKPILRPHWENIDPDKEHYVVIGAGYEFLRTSSVGKVIHENRITFDVTPGFRPLEKLLVRDRNWLELRWINGTYSTTYRNLVSGEWDVRVRGVRFSPYGSAEVFYDGSKRSWDQEWYTGGVQWPYKRSLRLDTYYRREHCPSCTPTMWNALGATLTFFLNNDH